MGMNAIIFQLKRAHLASMKAGRWLIRVVEDMTPARFDIMILLRQAGLEFVRRVNLHRHKRDWMKKREVGLNLCFMEQSEIVRELGLHKSTVSEALGRLEELGWIERTRDYGDRRNLLVQMTELGLARTAEACKILFRWDVVRRPVDRLVRELAPGRPFNEAFERVWTIISELARFFGDTSTFGCYERQISYEVPDYTEWEHLAHRLHGCDAGTRLPDFVIQFLYRWEHRDPRSPFHGQVPHPSVQRWNR